MSRFQLASSTFLRRPSDAPSTTTDGIRRSTLPVRHIFANVARALLLLLALQFLNPGRAVAQTDYQWQLTTSGGSWSAGGNWSPSGPANSSTNTADFGTLTLPANNTVHLNLPETIGSLIFGDQGNTYNWTLDNNGSASNILTLAGSASITVNNNTATIGAVLAGSSGLTLYGSALLNSNGQVFNFNSPINIGSAGTLVLNPTAVENYTGATTVNGGTLRLDNTNLSAPTNLIGSGSTLVLGGGTLAIADKPGAAATSQTFSGATLNPGFSGIAVSAVGNTNTGSTLALGAITANAGGSVNFTLPTIGGITTSTGNTGGILGAWATVGQTDWAVNSAASGTGNIAAFSSYVNDAWDSPNNTTVTVSSDFSSMTSGIVTNSLRFNLTGASTVLLPTGGIDHNTNFGIIISSSINAGILVAPNMGTNGVTLGSGNQGGLAAVAATGGRPLIINQYNTNGALNLGAALYGPVVKNGSGTLLSSAGDYYPTGTAGSTHGSYLNQGTWAFYVGGIGLPQGAPIGAPIVPWLTISGNSTMQIFGPAVAESNGLPISAVMSRDQMIVNAGATFTTDNLLSTNGINSGSSSDYTNAAGWNFNGGTACTTVSGAGSVAYTNSFGDSLFALFNLGNRTVGTSYTGTTTIYGGSVEANYGGSDNVTKFNAGK